MASFSKNLPLWRSSVSRSIHLLRESGVGSIPTSVISNRPGYIRMMSSGRSSLNFFQSQQLPTNTIIKFVPQQQAWVVERMGKFHRILDPGLAILMPFIDRIKYVKSLKESAIEIPSQSAITADNVTLEIDGVLYIRVFDAFKASYGVEDADYAVQQLAQTTMRSEIGQLSLDHVLKERQALNTHITMAINEAAADWGVKCLRYEIRDIHPPDNVLEAMHRQVSAERSKRAEILDSEGQRQSAINIAEGQRQAVILASEAEKAEVINKASGEAEAILLKAQATAEGIKKISQAIGQSPNGMDAISLQIAEQYVGAFSKLAKESNTIVVPAQMGDIGGWIASSMGIFNKVKSASTVENKHDAKQITE
ncbi:hypothetical protein V1511DRAFT_82340 [Dipodascopsis uninucleata]